MNQKLTYRLDGEKENDIMTLNLSEDDFLMIYCALTDEANIAYQKGNYSEMKKWRDIQERLDENRPYLHAEWIPWMKSYRIYDPKHPQQTCAYIDDFDEAVARVAEDGYNLCLCDADSMHVELYDLED